MRVASCCKGACTYDVCSGRGEGGTPKADVVGRLREFSTMNWSNMQTRGEGVKNPENFADVICTCPLMLNLAKRKEERKEASLKVAFHCRVLL